MYCGMENTTKWISNSPAGRYLRNCLFLLLVCSTTGLFSSELLSIEDHERKERMLGQVRKENSCLLRKKTLGHPSLGIMMVAKFSWFLSPSHVSICQKRWQDCRESSVEVMWMINFVKAKQYKRDWSTVLARLALILNSESCIPKGHTRFP